MVHFLKLDFEEIDTRIMDTQKVDPPRSMSTFDADCLWRVYSLHCLIDTPKGKYIPPTSILISRRFKTLISTFRFLFLIFLIQLYTLPFT